MSRNLQDEWEESLLDPPQAWSEIEDDFRFGWELSASGEFDGAEWDDVEHEVRRRWETSFPDRDYDDWLKAGDEVRSGFSRARDWDH